MNDPILISLNIQFILVMHEVFGHIIAMIWFFLQAFYLRQFLL